MTTPRPKRPFAGAGADPAQRHITSFFALEPAARPPALPASVQANLLSVGMRVRKSVPEGYRTKGPGAFKLWTDDAVPAAARRSAEPRELLPFCGINKVGGLGTQPESGSPDDDVDHLVPDLDAVPALTLSQETVDSNAPEPSRKRALDEDEDDGGGGGGGGGSDAHPGTGLHHHRAWDASSGNARLVAIPRRSRAAKGPVPLEHMGQENMAVDEDFPEADFLVFSDCGAMDLGR